MPTSHPMNPSHAYPAGEGAAMESSFDMYDDRPGYQALGTNATEEGGDPGSRPRLTQEQLVHLEKQFALHHKPNTEYKKSLAENMGVDYSKVNVSQYTVLVTSPIDIGHRTGFRTDELKPNMRTRSSSDLIHHLKTLVISYPRTFRLWTIGDPLVTNRLFTTLPQSSALRRQRTMLLASTSVA